MERTSDLRIQGIRPLLPPSILLEEIPMTPRLADLVSRTRREVEACLRGEDSRLVVVVGPCSIHDKDAVIEYAEQLKPYAMRYADDLLIVLRAYFEKPRTTVGWKGYINDPNIDGSFQINKGLRMARELLRDLNEIGLPCATEFLDMTIPQHIADFVSWGAIGARTSESQTHRELASGLSMPVGFKNATDGNVQVAVDAVRAAQIPHWFVGATKDGTTAILQTTGNQACHVILRGGASGPNYAEEHVRAAAALLGKAGLPPRVMVDCSHGNSSKDHLKQAVAAGDVANQIRAGGSPVFGVMLESFLVEGRQDWSSVPVYGQSITDACLGFEQTVEVLEDLAAAVRSGR